MSQLPPPPPPLAVRFFSDHCVPTQITATLRNAGYQVTTVSEVLPVRSPDPIVIRKAVELNSILLTLNGDFSDIVAYPPRNYLGIVAFQLHNHPEVIPNLLSRLTSYLQSHPDPLHYHGKLFLIEPHRIRIRH